MPPNSLGVQEDLHLESVETKIHVALKQSYGDCERDFMMGSPRPSYGRVLPIYEYQGLADGGRWGSLTRGRKRQHFQHDAFRPWVNVLRTPTTHTL